MTHPRRDSRLIRSFGLASVACVMAAAAVLLLAGKGGAASTSAQPCTPTPNPQANGFWNAFGTGTWTATGLLTTSQAAPGQPYGVTCGGASVYGNALPTTDPSKITALSFNFTPSQTGPAAQAPRLIVCFSDGANCASNAYLAPARWTAGVETHVDGFSPATGLNATWGNIGGTCGTTDNTTWSAIVACHLGASITLVAVVNDAGWQYSSGEQVLLNNMTVNNVVANVQPPVFGQSATVVPSAGHVMVKRHGSKRFTEVTTVTRIPYGAEYNATGGTLQVIAAQHGSTESGQFYDGSFRLTQGANGFVQATLPSALRLGSSACPWPTDSPSATAARGKSFKLWGHVKGHYSTKGNYGSASVLGTHWFTEETCAGTYFHVVEGTLWIRDFTLHKSVIIHAGQTYLAPSQPPDTFDHDGDYCSDVAAGLIKGKPLCPGYPAGNPKHGR